MITTILTHSPHGRYCEGYRDLVTMSLGLTKPHPHAHYTYVAQCEGVASRDQDMQVYNFLLMNLQMKSQSPSLVEVAEQEASEWED